jgi:hypothetical protein
MAISLEPYKRELATARAAVIAALENGIATAFEIAVRRDTVDLMAADLRDRPQSLEVYEHRQNDGLTGPALWRADTHKRAAGPYERKAINPQEWQAKNNEYLQVMLDLKQRYQVATHLMKDKQRKLEYLIQESQQTKAALNDIADAFAAWFIEHGADKDFLTTAAVVGLHRMLEERQDLIVALRLAQFFPKDVNVFVIPPEEVPLAHEVIEVAVSFIPVVGTAVAVFEVTTGYSIFGHELDAADRVIIGAGVLLPFAGRFVKAGRAMYTATRLEKLYGPQAYRWSMALAAGEKISEHAPLRSALQRADKLVRAGTKVEAALMRQVVGGVARLRLKQGGPKPMPIAKYLSEALQKLIQSKSILSELDELALMRVVEKGPNTNLMKGQLLEEFLEARIAGWLRDPAGTKALGISIPPPQTLEFIPGHLIRDAAGRQLTDGILAHREDGKLVIVAIFEAKAGRHAARELRLASTSISSLSQADRAELRAYARDLLRSRINKARLKGEKYPVTNNEIDEALDSIEREIVLSEEGGQVRRDIERLVQNADGTPAHVWIGEDLLPVKVSPKHTKVFGVLPRDIRPGNMEEQLKGLGYNFEVLGMNVTQKELVDLSTGLKTYVPQEHLLGPPPLTAPKPLMPEPIPVPTPEK